MKHTDVHNQLNRPFFSMLYSVKNNGFVRRLDYLTLHVESGPSALLALYLI